MMLSEIGSIFSRSNIDQLHGVSLDQVKETYFPISRHYKKLFGNRVFKIPVSIVDTCPNRMGLKKMQTCIFCDEWGSAAYKDSFEKTLHEQIQSYYAKLSQKYHADQFLVYFQAYTNSLTGVQKLREYYEIALSYPFVRGIIVGTRPDCLSPALLRLWQEFSERCYFSVELGVQSFFEEQVRFLRRGHAAQKSIAAIYQIHQQCPQIEIGIHFIFGLPGESDEHIIESAKITNSLPIANVKLHNLHVLKNTGLEELYRKKQFEPIELKEYARRCGLYLAHLSPHIPVHRLGALAPRWDELIAPEWNRYKMKVFQEILTEINALGIKQGQLYRPQKNYALHSFPVHLHDTGSLL